MSEQTETLGCTSIYHAWSGPPVGIIWEPVPNQPCCCGKVLWANRDKPVRNGYKTLRPIVASEQTETAQEQVTSHSMRKRLVTSGAIGGHWCGCNMANWCDEHRPAIFGGGVAIEAVAKGREAGCADAIPTRADGENIELEFVAHAARNYQSLYLDVGARLDRLSGALTQIRDEATHLRRELFVLARDFERLSGKPLPLRWRDLLDYEQVSQLALDRVADASSPVAGEPAKADAAAVSRCEAPARRLSGNPEHSRETP